MFYFRMDGAEISLIDGKRELRFMSGRDKKHSRHVPHDKKYQLTTATEPVFFLYSFFYLVVSQTCDFSKHIKIATDLRHSVAICKICKKKRQIFKHKKATKSESGVVKKPGVMTPLI